MNDMDVYLMSQLVKVNQKAKNLYKHQWEQTVAEWTPLIKSCQDKNKCSVLEAAIILCDEAEENYVAKMNILAVSVDIMENVS